MSVGVVLGQVPQTGWLVATKLVAPFEKLKNVEPTFVTHQPVKSWLNAAAFSNI